MPARPGRGPTRREPYEHVLQQAIIGESARGRDEQNATALLKAVIRTNTTSLGGPAPAAGPDIVPSCRVGDWRGSGSGRRMGVAVCRRLSRCRCLKPRHGPVSKRPSPNWAGGFTALGSPVGSCVSHTEHPGNRRAAGSQLAKVARLPSCDTRRFQWTAEPVDASTTPCLSSAVPSLGHVMLPGFSGHHSG